MWETGQDMKRPARLLHYLTEERWQMLRADLYKMGQAVAQFAEALRYNPEVREFDFRWCLDVIIPAAL